PPPNRSECSTHLDPFPQNNGGPGIAGPSVGLLHCSYGRTSQNVRFAIALAPLLSADVPGVNWPLSPRVLNDSAACCAFLIAFWLVPQYAASQIANCPDPPGGMVPKAEALSSAASSCCRSCIRTWSSWDRLAPLDVFGTADQKPPISLASESIGRP